MQPRSLGPIEADLCSHCHGIWFDRKELKEVDERKEPVELGSLPVQGPATAQAGRRCPRCTQHYPLRSRLFHPAIAITVDECPGCAGIYLDAGELQKIRSKAGSEADRRKAAMAAFHQQFNRDLQEQKVRSEHQQRSLWFDSVLEAVGRYFGEG